MKNILVQVRATEVVLWLTFNAETSRLDSWTAFALRQVLTAIRSHAMVAWAFDEPRAEAIGITKLDVALDLAGSMLPLDAKRAQAEVKARLTAVIPQIMDRPGGNIVSWTRLPGLVVRTGDNNLHSCLQYRILDVDGVELLNIKFYDKIMDLVGRDGYSQVSSRLHTILGCGHHLSMF